MTVSFSQMFSLLLPPFNIKRRTHDIFRQQHFRQAFTKVSHVLQSQLQTWHTPLQNWFLIQYVMFICLFHRNIWNICNIAMLQHCNPFKWRHNNIFRQHQFWVHWKYIDCKKYSFFSCIISHALPVLFGHLITVPSAVKKWYFKLHFWNESKIYLDLCLERVLNT